MTVVRRELPSSIVFTTFHLAPSVPLPPASSSTFLLTICLFRYRSPSLPPSLPEFISTGEGREVLSGNSEGSGGETDEGSHITTRGE